MGHLSVDVKDYPPGQTVSSKIDGGSEGPLQKGWIFGLGSIVEAPGQLRVALGRDGNVTERFVWGSEGTNFNTTRLQHDDYVDVQIHNPTNQTVRAGFYFDQSCNCAGKTIPLPGGTVFFDYEFPERSRVKVQVPILEGWGVEAAVATTEARGRYWPDDFAILLTKSQSTPGMMRLEFQTAKADTYYVVFTATQGVVFPPQPGMDFELTPLVDVTEPAGAPSLSFLMAAVGVLLGAGRLRRRA